MAIVDYIVPKEGTEPHLLAVALSGRFTSFFAGKEPPGSAEPPATDDDADGPAEPASPTSVVLEESPETRLVVVGNAQLLSDFVARALSQVGGGFFAENLRFAQNLIDWISLDNDMLEIRSRGVVSRRLDRSEGNETLIEYANYLIPLIILLALGGYLYVKRKNVPSLAARGYTSAASQPEA